MKRAVDFSEEQLNQLAQLAALELQDTERTALRSELSDIFGFIEKLSALDTSAVEPTFHVHGALNAFREDVVSESLPLEDLSKNSPDFSTAGFRVPKVI